MDKNNTSNSPKKNATTTSKIVFGGLIWIGSPIVIQIALSSLLDFNFGFVVCIISLIIYFKLLEVLNFWVLMVSLIFWLPKLIIGFFVKKEITEPEEDSKIMTFYIKHHPKIFIALNVIIFYILSLFIANKSNETWICIAIGISYGAIIWILQTLFGEDDFFLD